MMSALPWLAGAGLRAYCGLWFALLAVSLGAVIAGLLARWSPTGTLEAVTLLGAAILLFRQRAQDPIAAMLSIAFLLWAATAAPVWAGLDAATVTLDLIDRLRFLLFVGAMMLFPSGRFEPGWTRLGVAATLLAFSLGIAEALRFVPEGAHIVPAMGCALLAVAALRVRLVMLPPGVERQQIKWVALGLGIGLVLVAISRLSGVVVGSLPMVEALADAAFDLGVTAMALGVVVSLLRYRLYDADAAISRSTAVAVLTLVLVGTFAGAEAVLQTASQGLFGDMAGTISGAVAAALAAALIAPIHNWAEDWAERRFQPALAAFRREMPELLADLRETADLQRLGDALLEQISRMTLASRAALLVAEAPVALRNADAAEAIAALSDVDARFPDRLTLTLDGAGDVARLLLGARPDGSRVGRDEREAVAEIAGPLARAICAVQRAAERERRLTELGRRFAALETAR